MPSSRILLICLLAALPLQEGSPPPTTAEVADGFLQHVFVERNLDEFAKLLAPDVLFVHSTADIWRAPFAEGVRGRENLLTIMRGARVESIAFDVGVRFVCEEYAFLAGELTWKLAGRPAFEDVPLAFLLRVQEGEIVERWDHGAYEGRLPGATPPPEDVREKRAALARKYVGACSEGRFDDLTEVLAEEAQLLRPLTDPSERSITGHAQVVAAFRAAAKSWGGCELVFDHEHFNAGRALLIGILRDVSEEGREPIPIAWFLELEDGRIVEHRELLDTCALERRATEER